MTYRGSEILQNEISLLSLAYCTYIGTSNIRFRLYIHVYRVLPDCVCVLRELLVSSDVTFRYLLFIRLNWQADMLAKSDHPTKI